MTRWISVLTAALLLSACSSSGGDSEGESSTPTTSAAATTTACTDLVGQAVRADAKCGDFEEPGSAGCAPGTLYFFTDTEVTVFGKDGGNWEQGAAGMSISDMASKVGC